MSASSYGIIVEGPYDSAFYEAVIQRLSPHACVSARVCDGKSNLTRKFPALLKTFEHELAGRPLEMAIVIRDADGKNPEEIEAQMRSKIANRDYPFGLGVKFFAVPQAMESWLLADVNALNAVSQRRNGKRVTKSHEAPESLRNPKGWFREFLTNQNVVYTAEVAREIAEELDLNTLSVRCPRFRVFSELVDC